MTEIPDFLLPDILAAGLEHVVDLLRYDPEIATTLKADLMRQEALRAGNRSILFGEREADMVMAQLAELLESISQAGATVEDLEDTNDELEASSVQDIDEVDDLDHPPEPAAETESESIIPDLMHTGAIRRVFDPSEDLRNLAVRMVSLGKEAIQVSEAQDALERMVYRFLTKVSSDANGDIIALEQYASMTAFRGKQLKRSEYRYDPMTGLSLPCPEGPKAIRAIFRMARAIELPIEVRVERLIAGNGERAGSTFALYYDPLEQATPQPKETVVSCRPGMMFRYRYDDTQEIKTLYIAKDAEDLRVMTAGTEKIANGTPLARAVDGAVSGDAAELSVGGRDRWVTILDVWDPAESSEGLEKD